MTYPVSTSKEPGPPAGQRRDVDLWRGSIWALLTVAFVSVGGFAFWVLAAATTPQTEIVGVATAWYTLLQLTVVITAIGLPLLIARTGSEAAASNIAGAGIVATAIGAALLGTLAPFLAGDEWSTLAGMSATGLAPFFAIGAIGAGLTLGVDARLMSLRRWRWVFARSAIPVALRLPLLLIDPLHSRATWIVILAIGPIALSGLVTAIWLVVRGEIHLISPRSFQPANRQFFLTQHVAAMATQAPYYVVPFLVSLRVPGSLNAAFYLIWGIGLMVALVPQTLSQVLLSETSLQSGGRANRLRLTLRVNMTIGLAAWLGSLVLGRSVLAMVGPGYADLSEILPWLLLASLCWGVTSVCLTEARLAHDARSTNLITWTLAIASVGGCLLFIPGNPIWGATMVWLIANVISMAIGIVALDLSRNSRTGVMM